MLARTFALSIALAALPLAAQTTKDKPVPVNAFNFARAETDTYFGKLAKDGGFGTIRHRRAPVAIEWEVRLHPRPSCACKVAR